MTVIPIREVEEKSFLNCQIHEGKFLTILLLSLIAMPRTVMDT